jgi:hypothetical protein
MHLIGSRIIAFLDSQSLAPRQATEALFRAEKGFVLYLSDGAPQSKEKVLFLETREALLWLNEDKDDLGSFWHEASEGPEYSQIAGLDTSRAHAS